MARGQADRIVCNLEATDVPCLTEEGVAMFRSAAEDAGLDLTLVVGGDFPPALMIDRELWMRVLLNVVSNALKFTGTGSITVDLDYSDREVDLKVTDTGVGIATDDLPHIFDRFHQAPTRPVRGDAGSVRQPPPALEVGGPVFGLVEDDPPQEGQFHVRRNPGKELIRLEGCSQQPFPTSGSMA